METKPVEEKKVNKKSYIGQVVSDKMEKTIVVSIERKRLHALYKKYIKESKKIKAHDEKNDARIGDTVRVIETRPISKEKCWRLAEVLERAK